MSASFMMRPRQPDDPDFDTFVAATDEFRGHITEVLDATPPVPPLEGEDPRERAEFEPGDANLDRVAVFQYEKASRDTGAAIRAIDERLSRLEGLLLEMRDCLLADASATCARSYSSSSGSTSDSGSSSSKKKLGLGATATAGSGVDERVRPKHKLSEDELDADSTPIRSPVPRQSDQPFHGFPITPR